MMAYNPPYQLPSPSPIVTPPGFAPTSGSFSPGGIAQALQQTGTNLTTTLPAQAASAIAGSAFGGIINTLQSASFWKGLGLTIAAAVAVILGAMVLLHATTGATVPV